MAKPLPKSSYVRVPRAWRVNGESCFRGKSGFPTLLTAHNIEEALFIARRVAVRRSCSVCLEASIEIGPPYPRHRPIQG
jgi:hypothetical protein